MDDKRLNELLKWSIQHSENSISDPTAAAPTSDLTPELLASIMGGPSDADLMKASMEIITAPDSEQISLEDKLIAFDNFEQLIEGLDNANNIANLGLWTPLLEQLHHDEGEMRKMAAWCIGTAVQNNERTQERLLAMGEHGLPQLVHIATHEDEHEEVRRKAVYALSSACRNYQPSMDVFAEELTKKGHATGKVDATDMEAVDVVVHGLRDKIKKA
ncbi:nucleotide exchange factor Fes1-domain-containing protein [Dactylonectria estremocensis]|uniref:Nucleotide exchange factor Fes1-domain-containing protein n=1 Tax=Dactylonectria estremocensis TaxID=1079267 RepID=A0A9P9F3T3_9HYPO|nr:nucleotide exchange factor Fes1-domain-containing protein [Dactylonectria estremocensis]